MRMPSFSMGKSIRCLLSMLLMVVVWASPADAITEYYLDPDWAGTESGTQAQPFASLSASAWSTINTALATDDVTLYCSAREAGSDTNEVWGATINITSKTANPSFTLTFDGRSKYNTDDTTPSWSAYSGTSKCEVLGFDAQNSSHIQYNKVTIDGFVVVRTGSAKGIAVCGNDWIIKNSDISHAASASGGPLFLIVPTADAAHEGSGSWCPASSNITIQDNTIHDSYGELIYLGGAGCSVTDSDLSDANCNGKPSHSNITIDNNTLSACGSRASQGDCIDVKAAITNLTISRNDISGNQAGTRCIVTQGIQTDGTDQNIVIERNTLHDCNVDDGAAALANSWGTPNGFTFRNNIFTDITSGVGIKVYDTQATGVFVYNNTFYNNSSNAIQSAGTITVTNNAMLSNNGGGAQTSMSGTVSSTFNAFSNTWGGTCTSCVSGLTSAAFTNVAAQDFTLTSTSVLINQGTTIASFSNDYAGTTRPQGSAWDIGAYEFVTAGAGLGRPPVVDRPPVFDRPPVVDRPAASSRPSVD